MNGTLKGPLIIHRSAILDGLKALFSAQTKFDHVLKEDGYACGYREGFEDALVSIALMAGVADEFEGMKHQCKPNNGNRIPMIWENDK